MGTKRKQRQQARVTSCPDPVPKAFPVLWASVSLPVKWSQNTQFNEVEEGCGVKGQQSRMLLPWAASGAGNSQASFPSCFPAGQTQPGTGSGWRSLGVMGTVVGSGGSWLAPSVFLLSREGKSVLVSVASLQPPSPAGVAELQYHTLPSPPGPWDLVSHIWPSQNILRFH